jgi:glyoxylase-like metal-dependent hydrolase (beta-lactamase superfamily II)
MITIKSFTFNFFSTNTFVLSDETKQCIIIDPACSKPAEEQELVNYIEKNNLTPVAQVITHYHIDHVLGISFIFNKYGIEATAHKDGKIFWENSYSLGISYGFKGDEFMEPGILVNERDIITFGNSEFEVIEAPGHADGSICLINHKQRFLIAGDVIFYGSIGRTDLPTGDFDKLKENILKKIFALDDNYVIYPGHGQKTTVGMERLHNPFIN